MLAEGEAWRRRHNMAALPVFKRGVYCDLPIDVTTQEQLQDKPVSLNTILNSKEADDKVHPVPSIIWIIRQPKLLSN